MSAVGSDVARVGTGANSARVLVTGAAGYLGRLVVRALEAAGHRVIASDLPTGQTRAGSEHVSWHGLDVRDRAAVRRLFELERPEVVVHLAAIVNPPQGAPPTLAWDVDVRGTEHVLEAAVAVGSDKLIVTSSGAAYGYHPDNPATLSEDDALRGNAVFAYAHHKRIVEAMLAEHRERHPALKQIVLRVGTILGAETKNQITAIFERPVVLGIRGASSPFVFIWDQDVAAIIARGVAEPELAGIFNVAGDGTMSLAEIAHALGKRYVALPAGLVRGALGVLDKLGVSPYGPEQVMFLQHRPVLDNRRLREVYGFVPKPSREVFELWRVAHV